VWSVGVFYGRSGPRGPWIADRACSGTQQRQYQRAVISAHAPRLRYRVPAKWRERRATSVRVSCLPNTEICCGCCCLGGGVVLQYLRMALLGITGEMKKAKELLKPALKRQHQTSSKYNTTHNTRAPAAAPRIRAPAPPSTGRSPQPAAGGASGARSRQTCCPQTPQTLLCHHHPRHHHHRHHHQLHHHQCWRLLLSGVLCCRRWCWGRKHPCRAAHAALWCGCAAACG